MARVAIIGLGIMGSAYAENLIAAGVEVFGVDPSADARTNLTTLGGTAHETPGSWLAECDLIILALLSPQVMKDVCRQLANSLKPDQIVLETGTFSLADKKEAHDILTVEGIHLLDCPVSGTGIQAKTGDILMMASGNASAISHALPFMAHFTKNVIKAGEFGMGSRLKYVANHAVALHNAAAAETLAYSDALGLDRDTTYTMLSTGAGQSKMSDLRMPLMMAKNYDPPTASLKMFEKDLSVIGADLHSLGLRTPLFDAVDTLYKTASTTLPETFDTASVFEVYQNDDQ